MILVPSRGSRTKSEHRPIIFPENQKFERRQVVAFGIVLILARHSNVNWISDAPRRSRVKWARTAPELFNLGLLTRVDVPTLAAYCHAYGQWRMAAEALARMAANDPVMNGMLVKGDNGAMPNPLVSVARKHAADVVRYAGEFGMTALARSRLAASKFDGLLR